MNKLNKLAGVKKTLNKAPHLMVFAGAGTGKTTTMLLGLSERRGLAFTPSTQQEEIWKAIGEIKGKVCMTAFNSAIAKELQAKVPSHVTASTLHSLGNKVIKATRTKAPRLDQNKDELLLEDILGGDIRQLRKTHGDLIYASLRCASLAKGNFLGVEGLPGEYYLADVNDSSTWKEVIDILWEKYEFDFTLDRDILARTVASLLHASLANLSMISFDDMVWVPVICNMVRPVYDLLIVDEAQDLNPCQQNLVLGAGVRVILVGDPNQAIYAFAGADSDSMDNMFEILSKSSRGVKRLPLNITRRCGKKIVKEANRFVPDFFAADEAPEGEVVRKEFAKGWVKGKTYHDDLLPGDMVLCRCNGPLVGQAFQLIKNGVKAIVRGRDVGKSLSVLVNKMKARNVEELITALDNWFFSECQKEQAKKFPSSSKLILLQDKYDCIRAFCEDKLPSDPVYSVTNAIEKVFSDEETDGVLFSSIHKAKGLEANRVVLLQVKKGFCPHPMAKTAEAKKQETNLLYVAYTRAKVKLTLVEEGKTDHGEESEE